MGNAERKPCVEENVYFTNRKRFDSCVVPMAAYNFGYHTQDVRHDNVKVQDFRKIFFDRTIQGNGTYLFVRFPTNGGSNLGVVGQACVLATSTVRNCRGRFLGIARKVFESGYNFREVQYNKDEACVVFLFPNKENAINFFVSDRNFKQPDFPPPAGHCEAWTVDRYYTPENEADFNTFMISEVRLTKGSYLDLKHYYATPFANMMIEHGAHPFVVQTDDQHSLRRYFKDKNTIVATHLFRTPAHMGQVMQDDRYDRLQRQQNEIGSEHHSVFTLDPEACP